MSYVYGFETSVRATSEAKKASSSGPWETGNPAAVHYDKRPELRDYQ